MATIFLSYRRDDSAFAAGRIYDELVEHFGKDDVFMDVDSIPAGEDFERILEKQLADCQVMLVVLGPNWVGQQDNTRLRRIESPTDRVRLEVEFALNHDVAIIPLLVGGQPMLTTGNLPRTLYPLTLRQALVVRANPDFHRDMERVTFAIENQKAAYVRQEELRQKALQAEREKKPANSGLALPNARGGIVSSSPSAYESRVVTLLGTTARHILVAATASLRTSIFVGLFFGVLAAAAHGGVAFLITRQFPPGVLANISAGVFGLVTGLLSMTIFLFTEAIRAVIKAIELVVEESERLAREAVEQAVNTAENTTGGPAPASNALD